MEVVRPLDPKVDGNLTGKKSPMIIESNRREEREKDCIMTKLLFIEEKSRGNEKNEKKDCSNNVNRELFNSFPLFSKQTKSKNITVNSEMFL